MWRNLALAALLGASVGTFVSPETIAWAEEAPDPEAVRRAKTEFDEGSRAYRADRWELAASHFESADEAVPSERALRMALRARQKAGHGARAATLAAQAQRRYPNDDKTVALADEILGDFAGDLHKLDVTCTEPCSLTVGSRVVPGRRHDQWTLYLDPGSVTVAATFEGGGTASHQLEAVAGGEEALSLEPQARPPTPAPPIAPPPPATLPDGPPDDAGEGRSFIEHPGVFIGLLVATAGLGGVTIWSGIDTIENPGEDRVRSACRGEGTDCPEYQLGLEKQLRTNILIGATAGLGLLTGIIGIFVTDWGGDEVTPTASLGPSEGSIGLRGSF